jgi:hypothetical protein
MCICAVPAGLASCCIANSLQSLSCAAARDEVHAVSLTAPYNETMCVRGGCRAGELRLPSAGEVAAAVEARAKGGSYGRLVSADISAGQEKVWL